MRYYHDEDRRIVYSIPEQHEIQATPESPARRGQRPAWMVRARLKVTPADPQARLSPRHEAPQERFFDMSKDDAVGYFSARYLCFTGTEINAQEYARLHAQYEAEAERRAGPLKS